MPIGRLPRTASACALVLLLLPVSLAAAPLAVGTSAGIAADPAADLEGSLQGYTADGSGCHAGLLTGTAVRAHLENETMDLGPMVAGVPPEPGTPHHAASDHAEAALAIQLHEGCGIVLLPLGRGATVASAATRLAPGSGPPSDYVPHANTTRPHIRLDPGAALAAGVQGPLRLTGDVRIVLWEADVAVQDASGSTLVRAGQHNEPLPAPIPAGPATTDSRQTEAYLDLYGANLTAVGLGPSVLVGQATLRQASGALVLDQAVIQVAGRQVAGQALRLGAPAAVVAARSGSAVQVSVGQASTLDADGRPVALPHPVGGGATGWWLLGLAGAGLVLGTWNLKRATRRLATTDRYARTAALARWVSWLPLVGRDERVIQVVALLKMDRFAEAERELARGRRWNAILPTWDFLMAHLRARTGDRREAVRHLSACISSDPSYATDARADPALRPIVDEARRLAQPDARGRPEGYA